MNRASRDTHALLRSPLPHLMPFSTRRALAKRPKAEPLGARADAAAGPARMKTALIVGAILYLITAVWMAYEIVHAPTIEGGEW